MTHDESSMEKSLTKNFETKKISQLSQKMSKYIKIIIKNLHISKKNCTFVPKIELLESTFCFPLQQKRQMTIEPTDR